MLLKPKKTKFAKSHKGRTSVITKNYKDFSYAPYRLVAKQPGRIKAVHIAAAVLAMKRKLKIDKKDSKLYVRIFPQIPVSKKPAEVRMGKGKGSVDHWMTRVRPGTVLFEISCSNLLLAKFAFKLASSKLPIKTSLKMTGMNNKNIE